VAWGPSIGVGDEGARGLPRTQTSHEDTPTRPEVIVAHTLNFRPNFKFSRIFFLGGGTPSQFGCALGSLGQSLARVKIELESPSKGRIRR